MQLNHFISSLAFAGVMSLVGGCASRAAEPMAPAVATTELSSAELGEKHAPTPKVGKAQHAERALGDDEKTTSVKDGQRRSYEVFGNWK